MSSALNLVKLYFPNVVKVVDAEKDAQIEVTDKDTYKAHARNHRECALAIACKRAMSLDGAIISVGRAYLVKDKIATRYLVPESIAREITSIDRGAYFDKGTYTLKMPTKSMQLGADHNHKPHPRDPKAKKHTKVKITQGIRHILN